MRKRWGSLFYIVSLGAVIGLIVSILHIGRVMEHDVTPVPGKAATVPAKDHAFTEALAHPLAIFILQIIIIIIMSQVFIALFRKMGQPAVIGEIVAGIALGPSLMGWIVPDFSAFIFPASSLGNLQMLSQVGLLLFMFVIGMELNLEILKRKAMVAIVISHASIVIPYLLGVTLAYFMYSTYAPEHISFLAFALFMGIAMSITAFPVLARIIKERKLVHTRLGTISLTCAAADDITAWCLLALVIAIVKAGSLMATLYTLLFTILFIAAMLYLVKPLLKKIIEGRNKGEGIPRSSVAIVFTVLLISAFVSELIGIHALFGAFLAGVIMPQGFNFRQQVIDKTEDVSTVLLLPLFFVFTGLRTQVGLLNEPGLWGVCILIILVAIIGKFGGSALAARITGESAHSSLSIGALMNTRGLVELVVLNIGYDLGILDPRLFTMLVLMALVTTFMTNPMLNLINRMCKGHIQ